MPVIVNRERSSFTLTGADCEPNDADWRLATAAERKAYYKRLGELAIYRKRRELRLGKDVQGKDFRPIRYIRPDGAKGPPLSPHYANSRFQKWLRSAPTDRSVTIFWSHGWARIVGYHAVKKGPRRLPVRNAVGLTLASFRWAVEAAKTWWRNRHIASLQNRPEVQKVETPAPRRKRRPSVQQVQATHLDRFRDDDATATTTTTFDTGWRVFR